MTRAKLARLTAAALVAAHAHAADLTLGARTELWYDDNVLGTEQDEVDDFEVLITPEIGLSERWGNLDASLQFDPSYEFFLDHKDLRGFNYDLEGAVEWNPSSRTRVELRDSFLRYRSLRLLTTAEQEGGTPAESGARDRFSRNVAQLVASHRLTPIDVLQLHANFALWDFTDERRFDQQTYGAGIDYQHHVSRTVALGFGTSYSRVAIEERGANPERDTDYVNLSLIMNYLPADTFAVRASAGPTYIRQPRVEQQEPFRIQLYRFVGNDPVLANNDIEIGVLPSTCPRLSTGEFFDGPGCNFVRVESGSLVHNQLLLRGLEVIPVTGTQPDRDDFTYFADVSIERTWEAAALSLAYRRDEASNSGAGFSSVSDTVELRGNVRPWRELNLAAAVVWEDRKETEAGGQSVVLLDTLPASGALPAINNLVPVGIRVLPGASQTESVESITTNLNASYLVSARTRLVSAFSWRKQDATEASFFNDAERFRVMVGIRVELEPIRW